MVTNISPRKIGPGIRHKEFKICTIQTAARPVNSETTKLQLNFPQSVDEDRVGEILAQVSVTKREQDVMLSETDFDERRNVNKRKKLILEGKNPEEEAKKKERYLDKKRKAARKEMHKMQKQRKLEEQDVV